MPCQRGQHLVGVAGGRLVGLADLLGAFDDLGPRHPHPHRADMRRRVCRGRVDLEVDPVLAEIAVLVVAPQFAPGLAIGDDRPPACPAHLGIEVARLFRANWSPSSRLVVINRCACQFARSDSASPSCGACTSSCTASPLPTKCCSANDRTISMRSSSVIPASAGRATTISRATCASRRFSANSAVFHSTRRLAELLGRPSGNRTSWCSGASRWRK